MTNFYLDTHPDKKGDCLIRVSIRAGGQRLLTSIGYGINPGSWDASRMQVKPGSDRAPVYNSKGIPAATINARIAAIRAAFATLEATPGALTLGALRGQLEAITGKSARHGAADAPQTALAYFDLFFREESAQNQWATGTLAKMRSFRNALQDFKPDAPLTYFNEAGLESFVKYLRRKGQEEKSVATRYKTLAWFLRWAIRKGYCAETAVLNYRPKFKVLAKPVIFLTWPELMRLYAYEIPAGGTEVTLRDLNGKEYTKVVEDPGALAKTRDLFCFCAFTSLRYSDMAALKRTDIQGDSLQVTTQKTNDRLTIQLNNYSRAILDKYAGLQDPRGRALPVISNQRMNGYLKDLCELCGFNDPVTIARYRNGGREEATLPKWALIGTHAARRTFICAALAMGIPPQVVMSWTGHSDYQAMKPYIDIAKADAAKAMELFNK